MSTDDQQYQEYLDYQAYSSGQGAAPATTTAQPVAPAPKQNVNKQGTPTEEAKGFFKELQAGWQSSATGLAVTNKQLPTVVLPKDASMAAQVVSGIGQFAGDVPAIAAGLFGGGVAGSEIPVVGNVAGAAMGSFAVPAALRKVYMDHYEKGDIQTAEELAGRTMSTLWETTKGAATGLATTVAGPIGGKLAGNLAERVAGPVVANVASRLATPIAEVAAMTTAGKVLEGQLPNAKDFTVAGLTIAAIHTLTHVPGVVSDIPAGTAKVSEKLRNIYAETGMKPDQVAIDAQSDPVLHGELLSTNDKIPQAYEHLVEKPVEATQVETPPVSMQQVVDEPSGEKRTPEVQQFIDQIGEQQKTAKEPYSLNRAIEDFQDRLNPLKVAQKEFDSMKANPEKLAANNDPLILARAADDYNSKVKVMVEHGTLDFATLEKNGKGFNEIIDSVKDDKPGLDAYLTARRVLDYEKRGLNSGFDPAVAKEIIKQGDNKFGAVAKEIKEFQFRVLKYVKDAGLIDAGDMVRMADAGENYVPLKHIQEPGAVTGTVGKGGILRKVKGVEEGQQAKIQSPSLSILQNTQAFIRAAEKNRASSALIEQAKSAPGQTLIEKVTPDAKSTTVSASEARRGLDLGEVEIDSDGFAFWRRTKEPLKDNQFERYVDREREVYEARPDVARAMKSVEGDPVASNILLKLLRPPAAALRLGITLGPGFLFKNAFRDQVTAGAFTRGGSLPFVDVISAMGDLFNKSDNYYNWTKSGGGQSHFNEINEKYIMRDVFKNNEKTGFMQAQWNAINPKSLYDKWVAVGHMLESAPRLAEFKRVSKGADSGPAVFEAGSASREATVDFRTMGRLVKQSGWNQITAFMNPAIQGLAKTVNAIKDDPVGVGARAIALITVPSILLWMKQKDDPRYKDIPRWKKDVFWPIITDNWQAAKAEDNAGAMPDYLKRTAKDGSMEINKGVTFFLPKPQEIGLLFGSLPERILESYANDNPRAFKGFADSAMNVLMPNMMPTAVAPPIEQITNHSFFQGRQLIPQHLQDLAPQYQYTPYTSEVAKQLGKLTATMSGSEDGGMSPIVIDNYIRSWTGTVGQAFVGMADKGLTKTTKPESSWTDNPFVQQFITTHPRADTQQVNDLYDRFNATKTHMATMKMLSKRPGMDQDLKDYVDSLHANDLAKFGGTMKAISANRKSIIAVSENPDMSPHDKRQLVDSLTYQIVDAAGQAMTSLDDMDKKVADAEKMLKQAKSATMGQ